MRNTCSLVRLSDRAVLPVTAASVSIDCDSWAWEFTGTLFGADSWDLIRPQEPAFLPVEVELGINGWTWTFLIDAPSLSRSFGNTSVSIRGRSRSAWLTGPYLQSVPGGQAADRTANQLGEEALENTGWTLDWQLVDWLIPGGMGPESGTPIERLLALVAPVDGCLYTEPSTAVIQAYPRYASPAWTWEGQVADIGIPDEALLSWSQESDHRPAYNGVYVSGTTAGVLAYCRVAGTAGDLLAEQVVDSLISDTEGVAARARAEAVLSAAGPGSTISADTLLTLHGGTGPGLIRPGRLVSLEGVKGVVRSTGVSAQWSGDGLAVRQQLTIERREVEGD